MSDDIGIGKLIHGDRERDAIHIAVAPAIAGVPMAPGTRVQIRQGNTFPLGDGVRGESTGYVGVVDPFLETPVQRGERFYIFLCPGSIKSIRHDWAHPAFDAAGKPQDGPNKAESEAWLREYAKRVNPYYAAPDGYYYEKTGKDESYEILMTDLAGNTITYHGIDMHSRGELEDEVELQRHASIVLGRPVNFDSFEYFSCSC